jgi:possible plasmid maintenance system antidote protein
MSEKDLHLPKIAMRIKAQAALRNMKQLDLAKYLKIAPATMSQKLNGKIRISAD